MKIDEVMLTEYLASIVKHSPYPLTSLLWAHNAILKCVIKHFLEL